MKTGTKAQRAEGAKQKNPCIPVCLSPVAEVETEDFITVCHEETFLRIPRHHS